MGRGVQRSDYTTDVIRGAWDEVVQQFAGEPEWGGFAHPNGAFLFFNIPDYTGREWPYPGRQYVLNIVKGAWCEFLGIPAAGWATFEGRTFFSHFEDATISEWGEQFTTDDGRPSRSSTAAPGPTCRTPRNSATPRGPTAS